MTDDGELKQQFKLKAFVETTDKGTCIELTEAFPILDAAKTEFPMKLWIEDNHNLTQEQIDKIDCECNRQTLQWFNKWFGLEDSK